MLRIKPTFYLYINKINKQTKKNITNKYIEQITHCVLADITENSKQAELDNIKGGEVNEKVLSFSNISVTIRPQNGMEV